MKSDESSGRNGESIWGSIEAICALRQQSDPRLKFAAAQPVPTLKVDPLDDSVVHVQGE